jgi:hypothetical protein
MLRKTSICAISLSLAWAYNASAQQSNRYQSISPRAFEWTLDAPVAREDSRPALTLGDAHDDALLASITTWLSTNFDLPAIFHFPRVEYDRAIKLSALDNKGFVGHESIELGKYDPDRRTIVVPEGWTARTPAEQSIVVRGMVHHLQYLVGQKFDCPLEREKLAYVAQERWLTAAGTTLEKEFGIDPQSFLMRTECYIP